MEETVQWGQNAETAETKSYLLLWDESRVCCRGLYCVAVGCIVLPWAVLCCRVPTSRCHSMAEIPQRCYISVIYAENFHL